ncbi:hypothetical protein [Alkalibacterium kapii]|uniref:Uncharacterized protein n=1 Tax=Alkalibacterium kapii TaxID=426704 RepID=A0A511AVI8_9LACT|nr:hypothetical protein [Alkalibacterium kapii]GEK92154.1 hypothetical protein AKA01nite_17760 [Alkalibacterium kapii]
MTCSKNDLSDRAHSVKYRYLIVCREKTVELEVMNQDILYNADGELDCPLDMVLHKNGYSFNDLMAWDAKEIHFIRQSKDETDTVKSVKLNVNL